MEVVGWVLAPGKWLHNQATDFWSSYVDLRQVHQENERLRQKLNTLKLQLTKLQSQAAEAERLRDLLQLQPPPEWRYEATRVIGHRVGPDSVLESLIIDKGARHGVQEDMPVVTPQGVVGRVKKKSLSFSQVLLITDPNSRIPVLSNKSRNNAVLKGQGQDQPLEVKYVTQNVPFSSRENLLTSGLAGIFPKGLPVAEVQEVLHSELSLFQEISAAPFVDLQNLEEVLLLKQSRDSKGPEEEF